MSDSDSDNVPSDIEAAAQSALSAVIPQKSRALYDLAYGKFEKWLEEKKIKHINEKVLLAYFEGRKTQKASTLWTLYSMLRSELSLKKNIDITKYTSLYAFLKRQSEGYQAKKSNIFSKKNVYQFITEAEDRTFLMAKVALIVGIGGACRKGELTFLRVGDVSDEDSHFVVKIPNTKTKVTREFVITEGNIEGQNFLDLIRKYIALRPQNVKHDRFFIKYTNGKCGVQPVGINTIGNLPKTIAQFLKLPNPVLFTGHCFRRSSATLLADSGADILKLKQHGGWRSSTVAEGYVENSIENKKRIATDILGESSSSSVIHHEITSTSMNPKSAGVNLTNCSNCVINIYNA